MLSNRIQKRNPISYIFPCNTHVTSDTGHISIVEFFVKTRYSFQSRSFSFPTWGLSVSFENRNSRRYSVFPTGRGDARKIFRSRIFNLYHFPFRTLYEAMGEGRKKSLMCVPYYRFLPACTGVPQGRPSFQHSDVRKNRVCVL